mmetsp:Transcript_43855/g.92234  ORF Transcript_43855/g.92234 Transcript_43855/m.92234 type:complete len:254 (-) Transcript_43855:46-807(-)
MTMRSIIAFAILFLSNSPSTVKATATEGVYECPGGHSDCGSCTAAGCLWWADTKFCEQGCGMNGCGASVCASDLTTCDECLESGDPVFSLYSWSPSAGAAGECFESCMDAPQDVACYDGSTYDTSICESISVCRTFTDCTQCLEGGACAWSAGSCYDSCGDFDVPADASCFEGKTYTPSQAGCPVDCQSITGCRKCMRQDECAWSVGQCFNGCTEAPADAACYPGSDYGRSICRAEDEDGGADIGIKLFSSVA